MPEVLAYWHPAIVCIGIEGEQLRGKVLSIVDKKGIERKTLYYDKDKQPYIIHRGQHLTFCDYERKRLGI